MYGEAEELTKIILKIDNIILNIFNKPLDKQPDGIIDIGCGDGTFLKHIYKIITNNTIRGEKLNKNH